MNEENNIPKTPPRLWKSWRSLFYTKEKTRKRDREIEIS